MYYSDPSQAEAQQLENGEIMTQFDGTNNCFRVNDKVKGLEEGVVQIQYLRHDLLGVERLKIKVVNIPELINVLQEYHSRVTLARPIITVGKNGVHSVDWVTVSPDTCEGCDEDTAQLSKELCELFFGEAGEDSIKQRIGSKDWLEIKEKIEAREATMKQEIDRLNFLIRLVYAVEEEDEGKSVGAFYAERSEDSEQRNHKKRIQNMEECVDYLLRDLRKQREENTEKL